MRMVFCFIFLAVLSQCLPVNAQVDVLGESVTITPMKESTEKPPVLPDSVVFSEHCGGTCAAIFGTTPTAQCWEYVEQTHEANSMTGNCGDTPYGQVCGTGGGGATWLNGTHMSWTCVSNLCTGSAGIRCGNNANGTPRIFDTGTISCMSRDGNPPGIFGRNDSLECDGGFRGDHLQCYCDESRGPICVNWND